MNPAWGHRLRTHRNPVRMLFSATPWLAAGYLASYVLVGTALFAAVLVSVTVTSVLGMFTLGLPLLIGAAWIVRGCAQVERGRARLVADPIPYAYQPVDEPGLLAHIKARCTDPAVMRDFAYLVLLFPLLLVLDVAALGIWLLLLAGVTLPLWYHPWFLLGLPQSPDGVGVWITDLPSALIAALVCLVGAVAGAYLVSAAARLHVTVAHAVLRPPTDPLAAAKQMLASPGPLTS